MIRTAGIRLVGRAGWKPSDIAVCKEAADVANFAMMIAEESQ
jgi:hypothetical protein